MIIIVLKNMLSALLSASLLLVPLIASAEGVGCLYKHPDFQGDHICHDEDVMNFKNSRLNDAVFSIRVVGNAKARLFEHSDFQSYKRVFTNSGPRLNYRDNDAYSAVVVTR